MIDFQTFKITDGDLLLLHFNNNADNMEIKHICGIFEEWLKNTGLTRSKVVPLYTLKDDSVFSITKITANDPFENEVLKNGV